MAPTREELRAFAHRSWVSAESEKREFLARAYRRDPAAHFESICSLREHLRAVQPEWPRPEEVAADLAELVEWKRKIDHASAVLADRRDAP